jgi:hypothetical protein
MQGMQRAARPADILTPWEALVSGLRFQDCNAYATAGWLKMDKELLGKRKSFSRICQNVALLITSLSRLANPIGCDEQLPNMGRADALVPLVRIFFETVHF